MRWARQVLPSNFLAFAVDADGDGRRDLWGSVDDVVASTANFLAKSGWQVGQPWGAEVRLPPGFNYARADDEVRQPSAWASEGVQLMDEARRCRRLPTAQSCSRQVAAGQRFWWEPTSRVILRYNNATSYALAVGLLAQRLAGDNGVQAPWPRDLQLLSRSQLLTLQAALNTRGFDSGKPDGMMGPATRRAVRLFQLNQGLATDGYPTLALLQQVLN